MCRWEWKRYSSCVGLVSALQVPFYHKGSGSPHRVKLDSVLATRSEDDKIGNSDGDRNRKDARMECRS